MKSPARTQVGLRRLTAPLLYKMLLQSFPKKNDYYPSESAYAEELLELADFGIDTVGRLTLLLKKQRRKVIQIDRTPMDHFHQKMYRNEMGSAVFADFTRRQFWFAYPGLLRLALELEFGERYEAYARKRDQI